MAGGEQNQRTRSREVIHRPQNGGLPCSGNLRETAGCGGPVVASCLLSEWSEWSACSHSCSAGYHTRSRSILAPAQGGGDQCQGRLQELSSCGTEAPSAACLTGIALDCRLSAWDGWSGCDGDDQRFRARRVDVPASGSGARCAGSMRETETCFHAKIDCRMSDWTQWDTCDRTCGGGQTHRQRQVEHFPENGGETCSHELMQTKGCNSDPCSKQDAELSDWSAWSACTSPCGHATERFSASADRAAWVPRLPWGRPGPAPVTRTVYRSVGVSDDCIWRDWSSWSACSCTCDGGQRTRDRMVKQMPTNGGAACSAEDKEQIEPCNTQKCAGLQCIDGQWGVWTDWGMCSQSCGGGVSFRHRPILQEANACGTEVTGKDRETRFCNTDVNCEAPVDCVLALWGLWSPCSASCDGIQRRARVVLTYGRGDGKFCEGAIKETRPCNPSPGELLPIACSKGPQVDCQLSEWAGWGSCTATCGGGSHVRGRKILVQATNGGKACDGRLEEIRECSRNDCAAPAPQDCKLSQWQEWGACSKCSGQRLRYRNILQYAEFAGLNCNETDTQESTSCPRKCDGESFCVWATWEEWQRCTAACGTGGKRTRRRYLQVTSDPTSKADALQPVQDLVMKYSALYMRTEELEGSHLQDDNHNHNNNNTYYYYYYNNNSNNKNNLQELFVAFGAGCLSLLLLLGLGVLVIWLQLVCFFIFMVASCCCCNLLLFCLAAKMHLRSAAGRDEGSRLLGAAASLAACLARCLACPELTSFGR
ncbi:unnamed protein product [Polarella glacialis]|uniref:Spondin-like TSP1 domain-containing protein n=1 Tax=Polarella glacialis TaxID=89957 RepID=A0A813JKB8_POLGL|nr:unnamed protein product [Polarella glacialis]